MKNRIIKNALLPEGIRELKEVAQYPANLHALPEILFITSYPPRECGIATFSQDLIKALENKFDQSFAISICALESESEKHHYSEKIKYTLNTDYPSEFISLAKTINDNTNIQLVMIQHEFGFFEKRENNFQQFLEAITKPVVLSFHTVIPQPDASLRAKVLKISDASQSLIVMTKSSKKILIDDYGIAKEKIAVIPHGTHLVPHSDKNMLKEKYHVAGKKVLSTFGLLSSGKSIETTLAAMPEIIEKNPDVLFLIIGKTHPSVVKHEGEKYRSMLEAMVVDLQLQNHVQFINYFLPLPDLLEYLQLTDIYLFTSKDPVQAVSGTFSYAISCGCPVVSTPMPHAREVLRNDAGIIVDFENPKQLSEAVTSLLNDEERRRSISSKGMHRIAPTVWENAAIAHAILFEKMGSNKMSLQYNLPAVNLDHIKKLTTDFGIVQFSIIDKPDMDSGYTLDDNARALIAITQQFELTIDPSLLQYIYTYFNFIKHCLQPEGHFLNYVDEQKYFTEQNNLTNLADANGRAIWALGYLISMKDVLPIELVEDAEFIMRRALLRVNNIHSTRAMAFVIKGLYYSTRKNESEGHLILLQELANRMVQMYRHESDGEWQWFESYLTYANSILPEALLCAWLATGEMVYKEIAQSSFDFLLAKTFRKNRINVISNKTWLHRGMDPIPSATGGEQPIDVAYTILALGNFYDVFKKDDYLVKMKTAVDWFLGNNHLHQIIYNPCTGGCFDGLEDNYVNLNQGAESTLSYLMARLTIEKYIGRIQRMNSLSGQNIEFDLQPA